MWYSAALPSNRRGDCDARINPIAEGIVNLWLRRRTTRTGRAATAGDRPSIERLEARRLLSVNVPTWHNDLTRQGLNASEAALTTSNVNTATFGKLFSYPVTGQVYAQPLCVSNLAIPGKGTRDVIFVVTENNDVYAL